MPWWEVLVICLTAGVFSFVGAFMGSIGAVDLYVWRTDRERLRDLHRKRADISRAQERDSR